MGGVDSAFHLLSCTNTCARRESSQACAWRCPRKRWFLHVDHGEEPVAVNSELDPRTVLMMLAGAFVVYVALEHPQFGTALLVGVGVVTLLHLLMKGS